MATNDYAFVTRWRVVGTVAEVKEILGDAASLPRWWPAVYLDVRVLVPGDAAGVGKTVELLTQGWLPYRLRWRFVTTDARPDGFTLEATGDFEGRGVWTFVQAGDAVDVTYDWRIRARKPILRSLSWLLKPVFAANHRWAMARGERSLALELQRRRARTETERAAIPAPPPPKRWRLPS
ncbi:MAG TPA: SRPBCC family protein [Myxococcaceae bacterium]|nr:SRPBCC family protein [Myxococcaceae bacterium]